MAGGETQADMVHLVLKRSVHALELLETNRPESPSLRSEYSALGSTAGVIIQLLSNGLALLAAARPPPAAAPHVGGARAGGAAVAGGEIAHVSKAALVELEACLTRCCSTLERLRARRPNFFGAFREKLCLDEARARAGGGGGRASSVPST